MAQLENDAHGFGGHFELGRVENTTGIRSPRNGGHSKRNSPVKKTSGNSPNKKGKMMLIDRKSSIADSLRHVIKKKSEG